MPFSGWFYTMLSLCKQSLRFYKIYYCCTSRQITPSEQTKMYKYTEWKKTTHWKTRKKTGKKNSKYPKQNKNSIQNEIQDLYNGWKLRANKYFRWWFLCLRFVCLCICVTQTHAHTHTHPTVSWEKKEF